jgi:hypothetical protein
MANDNTIFVENTNNSGYNYLGEHKKKQEKIEKIYSMTGIQQIKVRPEMKWEEMVFDKITLIFRPAITGLENEPDVNLTTFLGEKYKELPGFTTEARTARIIRFPEGEKQVDIKLENRKIGKYFPEMNLIIIAYNPFYWYWGESSNKSYLEIHRDVAKAIAEVKPVKQDITEKMKKMMIQGYKNEINEEIQRTEKDIRDTVESIKRREEDIVQMYRQNESKITQIEAMKELTTKVQDNLLKEIEEVKTLKFVKKVELEVNKIAVHVGKVTLTGIHTGEDEYGDEDEDEYTIYAGDYIIDYYPGKIEIRNKDQLPGTDKAHPHISYDVEPCWGNMGPKFMKLLGQLKIKELTFYIMSWLKTYNDDSPHMNIKEYYEARENEGKFDEEGNLI